MRIRGRAVVPWPRRATFGVLCLTFGVLRFTFGVSRFAFRVSFRVSRFTFGVSRFAFLILWAVPVPDTALHNNRAGQAAPARYI